MTRKSTPKYEIVHISTGAIFVSGHSKTACKAMMPSDGHRFMIRPVRL